MMTGFEKNSSGVKIGQTIYIYLNLEPLGTLRLGVYTLMDIYQYNIKQLSLSPQSIQHSSITQLIRTVPTLDQSRHKHKGGLTDWARVVSRRWGFSRCQRINEEETEGAILLLHVQVYHSEVDDDY